MDDRAWRRTKPNIRHSVDKQNYGRIVQADAPAWLGKGYGMSQASRYGSCMFGARFSLPPDISLDGLDDAMRRLQKLMLAMAEVPAG